MREIKLIDVQKILDKNGYKKVRTGKGSHVIYSNGTNTISIPSHSKIVNPCMFKRLCKENNLQVDIY